MRLRPALSTDFRMLDSFSRLFSVYGFVPQEVFPAGTAGPLWTTVGADLIVALSCFSIGAALVVGTQNRGDDRLRTILVVFTVFVFAVGAAHLVDAIHFWFPSYWIGAFVSVSTAGIAVATAVAVWPVVRRAATYRDQQAVAARELSDRNDELAKTLERLRRQREDLEFMNRFSADLDVSTSEVEIANMLGEAMQTLWPGADGSLYLHDLTKNTFTLATSWGEGPAEDPIEGSGCWAFRLGRSSRDGGSSEPGGGEGAGCGGDCHCYPIFGGGETHGLIQMRSLGARGDDAAVANLFPTLAERLGLALHNLRLKSSLEVISTRDSLTGLFNRRYMEEALALEERRVEREGTACSVIMFDLDHFKAVNDTHGHDVGDAALRLFADVVSMTTRATDVACRYGGEEFIVILPGTDSNAAYDLSERIRKQFALVSDSNMDSRLRGLRVSGGVACIPLHAATMPELLIAADGAMYAAKTAGRDRVEIARADGLQPLG